MKVRKSAPQLVFELALVSLGQSALLIGKQKSQVQCESVNMCYVNIEAKLGSLVFENLAYKIFC